jgi:hypothetical protein
LANQNLQEIKREVCEVLQEFVKVGPGTRILKTVHIKFIAPSKDETPETCKLNIAKSTDHQSEPE